MAKVIDNHHDNFGESNKNSKKRAMIELLERIVHLTNSSLGFRANELPNFKDFSVKSRLSWLVYIKILKNTAGKTRTISYELIVERTTLTAEKIDELSTRYTNET